jgi:hypothetical protein
MHPQERDLIVSVFDRVAATAGAPKDAEAEALIRDRARTLPDAVYALTQAVCLQEVALRQAQTRIAELERQVVAARPAAPGGFLGAAPNNPWGPPPTSVPPATSVPSVPPQPVQAAAPQYQPQYQPMPQYAQQQQAAPWGMSQGGGFLRGIGGTILGVAGGTLLAEGISSMFSGHHAGLGGLGGLGSGLAAEAGRVVENVTVNNFYGEQGDSDPGNSTDLDVSSTADDSGTDTVDF